MRIVVSLIIASAFAAVSSQAIAEAAPAEPAKTATSTPAPASPGSTQAATPVAQEKAAAPFESGVNQPLCTGIK